MTETGAIAWSVLVGFRYENSKLEARCGYGQQIVHEISSRLASDSHFAIYEPDLNRVWPKNGINREAEIRKFAAEHGWELRYYKDGLCAIFAKAGAARRPT